MSDKGGVVEPALFLWGSRMQAQTADIIELVDTLAPFGFAEEWDNCGLQAGDPRWPAHRVMIALDVTIQAMEEAKNRNAGILLTHHPLLMKPLKSVSFDTMPGSALSISCRNRISIVSAHTSLDKARDGLNDYFASLVGLCDTRPLIPVPDQQGNPAEPAGFGRIGRLTSPGPVETVAAQIKHALGIDYVKVVGNRGKEKMDAAAVCTGSGGSFVEQFLRSGADLYITGDIKYHEARRIEENGRALIDVGHFASEIAAVDLLYDRLKPACDQAGFEVEIIKYKKEKDPFIIL